MSLRLRGFRSRPLCPLDIHYTSHGNDGILGTVYTLHLRGNTAALGSFVDGLPAIIVCFLRQYCGYPSR